MIIQGNAAKHAFYYLLSLVSLVFMSIAAGTILFQIINKFIPDVLNQYSGMYSSMAMRSGISALVISAPIYFLLSRQIHKYLYNGEIQKDAPLRKWLTYFIMLITSIVMIGWMIGVINNFLDGELTAKFMLKALVALGISAIIFTYYLYDMRRETLENTKDSTIRIYAYGTLAAVIAIFIASLFVVESPAKVRGMKFDNMVLEDFNQIRSAINEYYAEKKSLPENLDALKKDYNYITDETLKDAETGKPYRYNKLENTKFELCSEFRYSNTEKNIDFDYLKLDWPHEAGDKCISQKVNTVDASQKFIR